MKPITKAVTVPLLVLSLVGLSATAGFSGPREDILSALKAEAGGATFSAERGKSLFMGKHSGGKPDTPSCTTCHTNDPHKTG